MRNALLFLTLWSLMVGLLWWLAPGRDLPPKTIDIGGPYIIQATITFGDGRVATEAMQECFVAWVEGSSTHVENVCEDRLFERRADAEALMPEAIRSFEAERPPEITTVDFEIRATAQ